MSNEHIQARIDRESREYNPVKWGLASIDDPVFQAWSKAGRPCRWLEWQHKAQAQS
jgi:hypothetical protein